MKLYNRTTSGPGVALVIVLTMLVLLSGLLVAFMTTAINEKSSSQVALSGATARQLSESTLNLVIGQIREGTTPAKESQTWASQPGAIRTYGGSLVDSPKSIGPHGASYKPYQPDSEDSVYKLYSADRLKVSSDDYEKNDLRDEVTVIENWNRNKPEKDYVDLNEPILVPRYDLNVDGTVVEPRYPIIDPRAKYTKDGFANGSAAPGIVDGFDAKISVDDVYKMPTENGASSTPLPYLPMPVKWMYVLRDGSIGNANRATDTNPIVGRTAFWTDDESCKLNINTSSEGTFWDTPTVSIEQESGKLNSDTAALNNLSNKLTNLSLGASQPAQGEFQRYPGHPMTTCLSPVLGWLWDLSPTMLPYPNTPGYAQFKEDIYNLSPYTPAFGETHLTTNGGTYNNDPVVSPPGSDPIGNFPRHDVPTKHLYATVDELLFRPERFGGSAGNTGDLKATTNSKITPEALEKVRFFLTANSRAPELNLFGRPRVTLWPIHENPALRTPFDNLFAFTSTVVKVNVLGQDSGHNQNQAFYLTRKNAWSPIDDYSDQNRAMYEYLQWLTGAGGPSQTGIPGFGGSFETKYSRAERDQILTEIFDYIRTVNLVDTGTAGRSTDKFAPYTPPFYKYGVQGYTRVARSIDGSGQVVPLKIGNTQGMGRFVVVSEAALVFTHEQAASGSANAKMRAMLVLEMASTMPGYPAIRETYYTKAWASTPVKITTKVRAPVQGTTYPELTNEDLEFSPVPEFNICNVGAHEVTDGRAFMPTLGFTSSMFYYPEHKATTHPLDYFDANGRINADLDPSRNASTTLALKTFVKGQNTTYSRFNTVTRYPYVSKLFDIPKDPFDLTITQGTFEVEIWAGESPDDMRAEPDGKPTQRLTLDFTYEGQPKMYVSNNGVKAWNSRFPNAPQANQMDADWNCIDGSDAVRSLEYVGSTSTGTNFYGTNKAGDLRLAAAKSVLPKTDYSRVRPPSNQTSDAQQLHHLQCSHGNPVNGYLNSSKLGNSATNVAALAKNGYNRGDKPPIIPDYVLGVERLDGGPGDFDRGLSKHIDGAFGNKVDEGNVRFSYTETTPDYKIPYFHGRNIEDVGQTYFSPNRQMPSVAMIGSLPTGVIANKPWQTLLFRPDRESTNVSHPGAKTPPDYLWLDLFHLPIVEPYAISEPFSTAGKVNMNHVIAPFGYASGGDGNYPGTSNPRSYLLRDTALRGVLKSTFVMAVPNNAFDAGHTEKPYDRGGDTFRWPIDLDLTLAMVQKRLNDESSSIGGRTTTLFRSAAEICDIDLYPKGLFPGSQNSWDAFWANYGLTGDNMRERPYANIYPRLTTKSNVFTVHMRCQAIKKAPGTKANEFDEKRDQVVGEYRGSATIERFIDPNDTAPDDPGSLRHFDYKTEKVEPYYRYRVISTKQFSPR